MTTLAALPPGARAADVKVPLTIDYVALREAIKHQIYTEPNDHAALWTGSGQCQFLNASDPAFSRAGDAMKFETAADFAFGVGVGSRCIDPIKWSGIIQAETEPYIAPGLQLKFHVKDLNLLSRQHQKTFLVGKGFDLIKQYFIPRLESFAYDLNPAVQQLGMLAELASTPDVADRIRTAIGTLRSEPGVIPAQDGV